MDVATWVGTVLAEVFDPVVAVDRVRTIRHGQHVVDFFHSGGGLTIRTILVWAIPSTVLTSALIPLTAVLPATVSLVVAAVILLTVNLSGHALGTRRPA